MKWRKEHSEHNRGETRRSREKEKKMVSSSLSSLGCCKSESGQKHDETLAGSVSLGQSRLMISDRRRSDRQMITKVIR